MRYNIRMPLYEYMCGDCRTIYTVLVGVTAAGDAARCPRCGSGSAERRISRFAHATPAANAADLLESGDMTGGDDPRVMEQWAKDMSQAAGEDLGPDFDEYIQDVAEDE